MLHSKIIFLVMRGFWSVSQCVYYHSCLSSNLSSQSCRRWSWKRSSQPLPSSHLWQSLTFWETGCIRFSNTLTILLWARSLWIALMISLKKRVLSSLHLSLFPGADSFDNADWTSRPIYGKRPRSARSRLQSRKRRNRFPPRDLLVDERIRRVADSPHSFAEIVPIKCGTRDCLPERCYQLDCGTDWEWEDVDAVGVVRRVAFSAFRTGLVV